MRAINAVRAMYIPLIYFTLASCFLVEGLNLQRGKFGASSLTADHTKHGGASTISIRRCLSSSFALLKSLSHSSDIAGTASVSRAMRAKSGCVEYRRILLFHRWRNLYFEIDWIAIGRGALGLLVSYWSDALCIFFKILFYYIYVYLSRPWIPIIG